MTTYYESDAALAAMARMHFMREFRLSTEPTIFFENTYFERIDALVQGFENRRHRALDLGCGLGASSLLLAERFETVLASDLSERFIATAKELQSQGWRALDDRIPEIGNRYRRLPSAVIEKVEFSVADALDHIQEVDPVDLVLALNLICRLPDMRPFLRSMETAIHPDGLLVIASPYTFSEAHSPSESWLRLDEQGSGTGDIAALLGGKFDLCACQSITFPFQDYPRRVHLSTSEVTVWRRLA
ncbi:MAG: methyltransferase domain-containing protein [Opitutales bacterium]